MAVSRGHFSNMTIGTHVVMTVIAENTGIYSRSMVKHGLLGLFVRGGETKTITRSGISLVEKTRQWTKEWVVSFARSSFVVVKVFIMEKRRNNRVIKSVTNGWKAAALSPFLCLERKTPVLGNERANSSCVSELVPHHKVQRTKWPDRIPALSSEIPERGVVILVRPIPVHSSHPVLQLFLHRLHRPVTDISEIDCRGRCAVLTGHLLVMGTVQGNLREWCPMELLASMDRSSPPSTADQCQTHRPPVIGSVDMRCEHKTDSFPLTASTPSNGGDGTQHKEAQSPPTALLNITKPL
ncbi:hypothetical protein DPX16_6977 [Anabarilius grahami]|uniref:Uncharacterized protein n=1 Tax=Anabarilius grahami TaxID=495550 RepID=A0A3N0Y5Z7_ANAGA|nr:hypothetical protein DPX16_6977 [Anabarilius grahami]